MNEAIERAQEVTGKVTAKQLLAVMKNGIDSMFMHGAAVPERPSYSDAFTFELYCKDKVKGVDTTHSLQVPGWVSGGHTSQTEERTHTDSFDGRTYKVVSYCEAFRPLKGFWHLSYCENLRNVLELLPADALVSFHVYLDAGTNEYLVRAVSPMNMGTETGLHSDHLYLVADYMVRSKVRTREFLISTTCGAHNSARFGHPR